MEFLDQPPESAVLTDYDRAHMSLYLRLLDAVAADADWQDALAVLFGLDPALDPDRARRVYEAHLARARWMTESGYRLLLDQSKPEGTPSA